MAYFFELPQFNDLTIDQRIALDKVKPIAISGGAGTGKTVISLLRHLKIMEADNKYSILITYTKTLGFYLKMSLDSIEDKEKYHSETIPPSQQVFTIKDFPFTDNWKVYEIIIDEAQDLTSRKLQEIQNYGENISYGADFNQQLYQNRVKEDEIRNIFPNNDACPLFQNFRNSYYILNFTKSIVSSFNITQSTLDELENENIGLKPIIFIINNFKSDTHNIAILLPFGDNRYDYEQSVDKYYHYLQDKGILCSRYYNEMHIDNIQIENVHITTFKSAKGLEFDTVIIPQLHKLETNLKNTYTVNEEDYYVALTRAKRNLYLIASTELNFIDKETVEIEYLNKTSIPYIDISKDEIPF